MSGPAYSLVEMRKYIQYSFFISSIFFTATAYAQSFKQTVSVAKSIVDYKEQLEAVDNIRKATMMYGPLQVHETCSYATGSLNPSTFSIQRIFPFFRKSRNDLVKKCLNDFCASGGNHTDLSKSVFSQYCVTK